MTYVWNDVVHACRYHPIFCNGNCLIADDDVYGDDYWAFQAVV